MIVITKHLWVDGLAIYPFIFLRRKEFLQNKVLLNHERIHHHQQLRWLWIGFFVKYLIEWLYFWIKYKDWYNAYRQISFEREAYDNEHNLNYLNQ